MHLHSASYTTISILPRLCSASMIRLFSLISIAAGGSKSHYATPKPQVQEMHMSGSSITLLAILSAPTACAALRGRNLARVSPLHLMPRLGKRATGPRLFLIELA